MKRLQATNLLICQYFLTSRSFLSLKPLDSYTEDFKSGSQLTACSYIQMALKQTCQELFPAVGLVL